MDKEQKQIFSLRKLSVGLASVAIGSCLFAANVNTAKADTVSDNSDHSNRVQENVEDQTISTQNIQQGQVGHVKSDENQAVDEVKAKLAQTNDVTDNSLESANSNNDQKKQTVSSAESTKLTNSKKLQRPLSAEKAILRPSSSQKAGSSKVLSIQGLNESKAEANDAAWHAEHDVNYQNNGQNSKWALVNMPHEHANLQDNGGYDRDYWGSIDANAWDTQIEGNMLNLTNYHGTDLTHVIVPNGNDMAKAGKNSSNLQVQIDTKLIHDLMGKHVTTLAISKTNGQINSDVVVHKEDNKHGFFMNAFGGTRLNSDSNKSTIWGDTFPTDYEYGVIDYNSNLTNLDLTNLDTKNASSFMGLFSNAGNTEYVGDLAHWNTSNADNMAYMFNNARKLKTIGSTLNWDTSNVKDMHDMFSSASGLTSLDVSQWDTSNVKDMRDMFSSASGLTSLDVSQWDTSNVIYMRDMFSHTSGLKLNLDKSYQITKMLDNCDITSNNVFDNSGEITTNDMILAKKLASDSVNTISAKRTIVISNSDGTTKAIVQFVSYNSNPDAVVINMNNVNAPNGKIIERRGKTHASVDSQNVIKNADGSYSYDALNLTKDGYVAYVNGKPVKSIKATLAKPNDDIRINVAYRKANSDNPINYHKNDDFAMKHLKELHEHENTNINGGYDEDYFGKLDVSKWDVDSNGNITAYKGDPSKGIIIPNQSDFARAGKKFDKVSISNSVLSSISKAVISKTNGDKVVYSDIKLPTYSYTSDWNNLDVSNVIDMSDTFYRYAYSGSLSALDVSDWDTSHVTDMGRMFQSSSELKYVDVSKWNVSNVTNMIMMFSNNDGGYSNITEIGDLSNWDTRKVVNMDSMFATMPQLNLYLDKSWQITKSLDKLYNTSCSWGAKVTTNDMVLAKHLTKEPLGSSQVSKRTITITMPDNSAKQVVQSVVMQAMPEKVTVDTTIDNGHIIDRQGQARMFADANKATINGDSASYDSYDLTKNGYTAYIDGKPVTSVKKQTVSLGDDLKIDVVYKVTKVRIITHDKPDASISGATKDDLNAQGTRTIIFNLPEGIMLDDAFIKKYHVQDGNKIVQTVQFIRNAKYDENWKKVKEYVEPDDVEDLQAYKDGKWWSVGKAEYPAVKLPVIPGYRLAIKKVPMQEANRLLSLFAVNFTAIPQPSKPTDDKGQTSQASQTKPEIPDKSVVPNDHKDVPNTDQIKAQPTQATNNSSESVETPAVIPSEPAQIPEATTTTNSDQVKETETKSDDQVVNEESNVEIPSESSKLASKKFEPVTNVVSHKENKNAYKSENKPLKAAKVSVQKSASTPDVSSVQATQRKVNDSQALPQTGEAKDNSMVYSAFALSLGLDLLVGAYVEKKKKES